MAWTPNEDDIRNVEKTREFCKERGIGPGFRFDDKKDGLSVFSRIGATGRMICHPVGEPDMQSSWAMKPEDFAERYLA